MREQHAPMDTFPALIACEHCDSIYRRRALAPHEVARCQRCSAVLFRSSWLDIDRWLALAIGAGVVFAIANLCPIMRISVQGLHSEATLWQSALALAKGYAAPIAIPTALAIVVVPFLQIATLIWLLAFARAGRRAPAFGPLMRLLVALRPWSMIEVGLLGILIAIIKLSSIMQIVPGAGLWATAVLMVLIPLIAGHDARRLWDWVVPVEPAGGRS
ncbi:paraquat-inducible protein A [Burkholderia sp. Se-20373]|uniref:paraquat-inducible protein A n=1 Tax=Burkholderia sp. Se-20373 TaxID=2703898 RepID=UPI00197D6DC1|nr:paraquat-inducible protein A [Burkholderia sp. Se-20373]MBN3744321.1 paraquat-inducible protein A [Burkholderia sp. Se-20373]